LKYPVVGLSRIYVTARRSANNYCVRFVPIIR